MIIGLERRRKNKAGQLTKVKSREAGSWHKTRCNNYVEEKITRKNRNTIQKSKSKEIVNNNVKERSSKKKSKKINNKLKDKNNKEERNEKT